LNLLSEEDRCKEALVRNGFLPEIAGRITSFLRYESLSKDDIRKIIRLEIKQCADLYDLVAEKISDEITDAFVLATGSKFGVRAHKQLIERKLGKEFADYLESGKKCNIIGVSGSLDEIMITAEHSASGDYKTKNVENNL
jgi:ATP-dependent Clp protease ATP-binding subunit ClpA